MFVNQVFNNQNEDSYNFKVKCVQQGAYFDFPTGKKFMCWKHHKNIPMQYFR